MQAMRSSGDTCFTSDHLAELLAEHSPFPAAARKRFHALPRQLVIPTAAARVGLSFIGADLATLFQPVQDGVERPFLHGKRLVRAAFQFTDDLIAVFISALQHGQHEHGVAGGEGSFAFSAGHIAHLRIPRHSMYS